MRLPVWVGAWEIECCCEDITVGKEWTAAPVVDLDLSWVDKMPGPIGLDGKPIGVLEGEIAPAQGSAKGSALVCYQGLVFGAFEELEEVRLARLSLCHRWHGGWSGFREDVPDDYPPDYDGVVLQLWGVKYDRARGPIREVTGQGEVRVISATALPGHHDSHHYSRGFDEFLVVVEVATDRAATGGELS
jgi:hypothetical protein